MPAPSESGRVSTGVATVEFDGEPRAGGVSDLCSVRDIAHRPGGIGRRLQPYELGASRPHRRAQRFAAPVVHLLDLEPPTGGEANQPCAQGPVHHLGHDHVVARIERLKHGRRRRHARAEQQRRGSSLQRRQRIGRGVVGRVAGARIKPAMGVAQVGAALVGRGRMDGRDDGARLFVDTSQCLRGKRFREHFLLSHRPCHTGTRFSMNAPMPSCASRASRLRTITSLV